jgi:DNA-binding MarR family transcriptional regulator
MQQALTTPIMDRQHATLEALAAMLATARKGGITSIGTLIALIFIGGEPAPTTAGVIASHIGISTAATTSILDSLEKPGLIERTHNRNDRRQWFVALTPKGKDFLAAIAAA